MSVRSPGRRGTKCGGMIQCCEQRSADEGDDGESEDSSSPSDPFRKARSERSTDH